MEENSSWREEGQHCALIVGEPYSGAQLIAVARVLGPRWGHGTALACWVWPPAGHGLGALLPNSAYPGALGLDGFDVQAVLHGLAGAAGLSTLLRAPAAGLCAGLIVPILLEQRGPEVDIVALLLGDMSIWAVHCFHMLPERTWVRVSLGTAWDLADIGFLGREAGSMTDGT